MQYWPTFDLNTKDFIGCCGLRPISNDPKGCEIGFHLLPQFWHKGYASEAAEGAMTYCF